MSDIEDGTENHPQTERIPILHGSRSSQNPSSLDPQLTAGSTEVVEVKGLEFGIWAIGHQALDWIGRGAVWLLRGKVSLQEELAYALTGGGLIFGIVGAIVGFALSDHSHDMNGVGGAILGGLFGVCMGVMFGSIVASIDDSIRDLLKSLNSR